MFLQLKYCKCAELLKTLCLVSCLDQDHQK